MHGSKNSNVTTSSPIGEAGEGSTLRTGLSTGSCATAASVAALWVLLGHDAPREVCFELPRDGFRSMSILRVEHGSDFALTSVQKDGGDDPDATNGCTVQALVRFNPHHREVRFFGGEGVGRVTLPGLGLDIGEPAINPVPRQMITQNLRRYYTGGLDVTTIVPGGREIARHTFNAKVGVVDGISILGTTGIVHPFSHEAYIDAMEREMQVALAMQVPRVVLNSGKRSEVAIHQRYPMLPDQAFIHYGNFVGDGLRIAERLGARTVTVGVMIGKAVKLAAGYVNTHSHQVTMDRDFVTQLALEVGCQEDTIALIQHINMARQLITDLSETEYQKLRNIIIKRCIEVCKTVYSGDLEFILLDSLL